MFVGHFAVALTAKKAAPKVSLGTLVLSTQFLDLLWPLFLITGVEHVRIDPGNTAITPLDFYDYPISHSLLTVIGWGALVGTIYFAVRRHARGAWILAAGVFSHWILDAISHRPDMPLAPGLTKFVGLGLWNSVFASVIVEGLLFLIGVCIYARITSAVDWKGRFAYWAFVGALAFFWLVNIFGPPPPDVDAIGWVGLTVLIFVPWGYWIDEHRAVRTGDASAQA